MRIVFMGTPESAVPSLRRLIADGHEVVGVWTQPDKPAGRGKKLQQSPVKRLALEHNISIHQPARIKTDEAKALFASHQAEVAVVVAYGRILPAEFLTAPAHGCLNLHFSLLPKYRGAAPVNWAIVNGESDTGVTTMQIVEELDAGPILLQRVTNVEPDETAPQLMNRLAEMGADLISETVRHLNDIQPRAQLIEKASFAPILKREDGLIDWSMDAFAIERRVRGFQPWPNAYTTFNSKRLIIKKAIPEPTNTPDDRPGQVLEAHADILRIACGERTALRVVELQAEGGRPLRARDFMNGTHLQAGQALGN